MLKLFVQPNQELEKLAEYMESNSLIINTEKTQAILFKPKSKPLNPTIGKIMLKNTEIKVVNQARYLGITIDNKLNFKKQFNILIKKLNTATRALLFTRKVLNYKAKMILYNSLFKQNLEYGCIAYFDKLTTTQINKITKLQKLALRLIFNTKPKVHTKKL